MITIVYQLHANATKLASDSSNMMMKPDVQKNVRLFKKCTAQLQLSNPKLSNFLNYHMNFSFFDIN